MDMKFHIHSRFLNGLPKIYAKNRVHFGFFAFFGELYMKNQTHF